MSQSTINYGNEEDSELISLALVGRKIVSAELGDFQLGESAYRYQNRAHGKLTLDDGSIVYLINGEGGCSCGAGDYDLEKVATVDNIITSARIYQSPSGDGEPDGEGVYAIYVVADATEINVAQFEGSDGNGYYGTGFSFAVVRG